MCHLLTDCLPAFKRNSKSIAALITTNANANVVYAGLITEIPQSLAAFFTASVDIAFIEISRYRFLKSCQCS